MTKKIFIVTETAKKILNLIVRRRKILPYLCGEENASIIYDEKMLKHFRREENAKRSLSGEKDAYGLSPRRKC